MGKELPADIYVKGSLWVLREYWLLCRLLSLRQLLSDAAAAKAQIKKENILLWICRSTAIIGGLLLRQRAAKKQRMERRLPLRLQQNM